MTRLKRASITTLEIVIGVTVCAAVMLPVLYFVARVAGWVW